MSVADFLIILLAGIGAGTVNTVVGAGSLITFPTLVALGYPPLLANVSNSVGLVPGGVSGVYGYRRELVGQGTRLRRLVPASILGALTGATLLLVLPSSCVRQGRYHPHMHRARARRSAADAGASACRSSARRSRRP